MSKLPGTLTVLLVDDDKDLTTTQSWLIEADGATVLTANTADECLQVVDENSADVILLDIGLPGTNGLDLCRRLRAHPNSRAAYFIAQTGYCDQNLMMKIRDCGFDGYLMKPVTWPALSTILEALKAGQSDVLEATWGNPVQDMP